MTGGAEGAGGLGRSTPGGVIGPRGRSGWGAVCGAGGIGRGC
ncbi:hypothetical protein AB4072_06520 [Microvirga sp. 2MCAF38]